MLGEHLELWLSVHFLHKKKTETETVKNINFLATF